MRKTLTLAIATLAVGAVSANAAIVWGVPSPNPDLQFGTPAFTISGTWDLVPTAAVAAPLVNWTVLAAGSVIPAGGGNVYLLTIDGQHAFTGGPWWSTALALLDAPGQTANAAGYLMDNAWTGDTWAVTAAMNPPPFAAGLVTHMDFTVTATCDVPEPSSYALFAGLGLVGFAAYRRMRA